MTGFMAGPTLNGSGERAAGRSACDRAASAIAAWAVMAALARFMDSVSSIWRWSAPGKAKGSAAGAAASGAGSGFGAGCSGGGAALAARGRGGLAEVGRPDLRGGRGAASAGGEVGRLAMGEGSGNRLDRSQGPRALPPAAIMAYDRP